MTHAPLQKIEHRTLANGLIVVALEQPHLQTAVLAVDVGVGARYERPRDNGLSHFLEHMVFQGCEGFPSPQAVNEAAERMGSALDANTGRDTTHFEHTFDPSLRRESATLLAAVLMRPAFQAIESERGIVLEEGLDELDEEGRLVDPDALSRMDLWPDRPIGQTIIGAQANIRRFTRGDLERHHAQYYCARNMVVTSVGPDPIEIQHAIVAEAFAELPIGRRHVPPSAGAALRGPVIRQVKDSRSQCELRLAFRTDGRPHAHTPALTLLRLALDDGLASRMHRRLGGDLGLAYEQWAAYELYEDTGAFELGAAVSAAKLITFVQEALALLKGLVEAPPTGDELARIKFRARWALKCAGDTAEGLVALYGSPQLHHSAAGDLPTRLAVYEAVTSEQLAVAADVCFRPENLAACVVGSVSKADRRKIRSLVRVFRQG